MKGYVCQLYSLATAASYCTGGDAIADASCFVNGSVEDPLPKQDVLSIVSSLVSSRRRRNQLWFRRPLLILHL